MFTRASVFNRTIMGLKRLACSYFEAIYVTASLYVRWHRINIYYREEKYLYLNDFNI